MAEKSYSYDLVAGDTGTAFKVTLTDAGTGAVLDLTGKTVTMVWRLNGHKRHTAQMTVQVPPTNGVATYVPSANDFPEEGQAVVEFYVADSSGSNRVTTKQTLVLSVRNPL